MKFNNEQLKAINTTNQNILVSASAGAGKTSVLVERLIKRCIKDGIAINKIIALTFTDAAASEMKKRLSKSLNILYQDPNSDHEYIKQQLVYLQNADISTIDAFCLKLVKKYYYVIHLDPKMATNILDDSTISQINNKAFDLSFKKMMDSDEEKMITLLNYFSPRSEDITNLKEAIFSIISCANGTADKDKWYKIAKANYQHIKNIKELPEYLLSAYYHYLTNNLNIIKDNLIYLQDNIADIEKVTDKQINAIKQKLGYIEQLQMHINNRDYDSFVISYHGFATVAISVPTKSSDHIKAIKDDINKLVKDILEDLYYSDDLVNRHNDLVDINDTLLKLAILCDKHIKEEKYNIKGMDFDDMEHYALAILKANDHAVSKLCSSKYEEIMVDEFQDTNEIQNEIIDLLSNGHNVFRVGDVKQSIYKFRKAKPELMRKLSLDENTCQIHLANNYRSKENIVEFNNLLFSQCMNIQGCKDSYSQYDNVKIGIDAQKEVKDDAIIFYALKGEKGTKSAITKAMFIAQKIKELKEKDPTSKYQDYVVLLRSHADKKYLKDAFEAYDIPYNVDAKDNFYNSKLCLLILSYLSLLVNVDDISLISVLSSFYHMTNDELALLKLNYGSIYEGIVKTDHPIIKDLSYLKDIYQKYGLVRLLDKIILINDFYENLLNNKEKTNFDNLYSIALNYVKNYSSLEKFIDDIKNGEGLMTKEVTSMSSDSDVVRAVTIHQSKGLQYKTIFLWSSGHYSVPDTYNNVVLDSELGIALKPIKLPHRYVFNSIERIAIEDKIIMEELEENTRLLYVALTRAMERIYIVDTIKQIPEDKIDLATLLKRKGSTNLILTSISDNPYIKVECIDEIAYPQTNSTNVFNIEHIKHYPDNDSEMINIISPSNTHITKAYDLNPSDKYSHGTKIHEILEKLPLDIWTKQQLQTYHLSNSDIEHLLKFNQSDIFKSLKDYQVYREYPFIYKKDNQFINGTIDLLLINDHKIKVIDYKTNRNTTKDKLIEMYHEQLAIYRDIMKNSYPHHEVSCYIYAFMLDELIEVSIKK